MAIDYTAMRADLRAKRDILDAALAALDALVRTDVLASVPAAPPQPAAPRRSSHPGATDPAPAPTAPSVAPTRSRKAAPTRRPASTRTATPGPSNVEKSQLWQAHALTALQSGEDAATVRELATRLRLTGEDAYQSLWRALQVLVAHKVVVRSGTRYRLPAKAQAGEAG